MAPALDRRMLLRLLGGAALAAAGAGPAWARVAPTRAAVRIARLIAEARAYDSVSARIDFISRSFLGKPYRANTLIGGPWRRERFVVRDDVFDCVTFCETVLAAALARDYGGFETALKTVRYANGAVRWRERNHYFADWSGRAVQKEICRPIEFDQSVTIDKRLHWGNFGRRQVAIRCIPADSLLAEAGQVSSGDIIGFVSRRPNLDFFHTGLVMRGQDNSLVLRHASQRRGRVVDEPMAQFVEANRVQYVTLLRVLTRPAA